MLKEAIYHRPKGNFSYAYDTKTLHIRVRTKKQDADHVRLIWGDKYNWKETIQETPMYKFASDTLFDYYQAEIVPPTRRTRYAFGFVSQNRKQELWMTERTFSRKKPDSPDGLFEFPFLNPIDVFQVPEWAKDAIFYQIFPERFANGDPSRNPEKVEPWGGKPKRHNFFGGDLQGVLNHLDYLEDLGINAIYFTPIFHAPSNHKYDTIDYKTIDPHFGDLTLFKTLVDACHKRGIRVILDAVFNHCGYYFPPFQDVVKHGRNSKYADWFHIRRFPVDPDKKPPDYDCFAFYGYMPKFNTEHPEVKAYLLEVARYWIEVADIDGWRLDVANEVDHAFWREFRNVVKAAKPDALIIGEIWHDSGPWLQGDQFDTVMNYPFADAVLDFFARNRIRDAAKFDQELGKIRAMYPQQVTEVMFNLLDSHDTARLLTLCKHDVRKMKLASAFQMTYPGTPCVYYGDEIGMTGKTDPDCRKPFPWEPDKQNQEIRTHYKQLIHLRKQVSALRRGDFQTLYAAPKQRVYAFARRDSESAVIAVFNNAEQQRTLHIPLDPNLLSNAPGTEWFDPFQNTRYHVDPADHSLTLTFDPYAFRILVAR